MLIEVTKADLIRMIKGCNPSYEQMDIPAVKENGYYNGSYGEWLWNEEFKGMQEFDLHKLYKELSKAGSSC